MTLAQIDQQIAKWRQLQSNVSIKLVDLDETPAYLGIRSGLYQGTTALATDEIRNHIDAMWTLSAQWSDAFAKVLEARGSTPTASSARASSACRSFRRRTRCSR